MVELGKNNGVVGVKRGNSSGTAVLDDGPAGIEFESNKGLGVYSEDVDEVELELDNGNNAVGVEDAMIEELMVELSKRCVADSVDKSKSGVEIADLGDCATLSFEAGARIKFGEGFDVKIEADVETEPGKGNGEDNAEVYSVFGNKSIESGFIPNNPQEEIERTPAFPT